MSKHHDEDFLALMNWSIGLKIQGVSSATILKFLLSTKKTSDSTINSQLWEMRELYKKHSTNWQERVLNAILCV